MTAKIILASASPRRSELLKQIGVKHSICAVEIDETPGVAESPQVYAQRMAAEKSAVGITGEHRNLPVLSADTSVVCDGVILGKPENRQHAVALLNRLSGRSHLVYTAVSLRGARHEQAISVTEVKFRPLLPEEIMAYCGTAEPFDKAGAYAIQGLASIFIESINGSFSGVMGLPLFETAQLLARQGIEVLA
jgi:septum formation protein